MTNPVPLELQMKIAQWRQKAQIPAGEPGSLTREEMKEAIVALRAGRVAAANASATAKRKRAIAEIPAAADMLNDLADM